LAGAAIDQLTSSRRLFRSNLRLRNNLRHQGGPASNCGTARAFVFGNRRPEMTMSESVSDAGFEPRIGRSVSLDHAAELLGVSRRTIYNRIRDGRLQTIRTLGGSQRVLIDSVQEDRSHAGDMPSRSHAL
jgi:excisionase family DNA binding protein